MQEPESEMTNRWQSCFPELAKSNDPAIKNLMDSARIVTVPAQEYVCHMGATSENYLLALEGTVRVQLTAPSGREVTLYRVQPGGSCILTTSCLLSGEHFPAEAIAETNVTALTIDKQRFQQALDESAEFRRFVFANISKRLADIIRRMEAVTFTAIDKRLAGALIDSLASGRVSSITHQALAVELGTAREVISRHLKRFEADGLISLGRGRIEITDPEKLALVRDTDPE
jgi:CRP/FNR family transcriptional regulator